MGKFREFKLVVHDWHTNALPWNDDLQTLTTGEEIRVIEYAALTRALEEIDQLKKQLAVAREALRMWQEYCDSIADDPTAVPSYYWDEMIPATEQALEQIKELEKEKENNND